MSMVENSIHKLIESLCMVESSIHTVIESLCMIMKAIHKGRKTKVSSSEL